MFVTYPMQAVPKYIHDYSSEYFQKSCVKKAWEKKRKALLGDTAMGSKINRHFNFKTAAAGWDAGGEQHWESWYSLT